MSNTAVFIGTSGGTSFRYRLEDFGNRYNDYEQKLYDQPVITKEFIFGKNLLNQPISPSNNFSIPTFLLFKNNHDNILSFNEGYSYNDTNIVKCSNYREGNKMICNLPSNPAKIKLILVKDKFKSDINLDNDFIEDDFVFQTKSLVPKMIKMKVTRRKYIPVNSNNLEDE